MSSPRSAKLLPDHKDVLIKPVPPRLEDSFVTMLRKRAAGRRCRQIAPGPTTGDAGALAQRRRPGD